MSDRQTDRQTEAKRQTERQTGRQRQTDRHRFKLEYTAAQVPLVLNLKARDAIFEAERSDPTNPVTYYLKFKITLLQGNSEAGLYRYVYL
jgi:hypothetical protein